MQKIQKFQFGHVYVVPKSSKTYELLDRDGHSLVFRVRNPKTRDSWKQLGVSTFKADETGAFEEILFSDGVRLRSDAFRKVKVSVPNRQGFLELMAALVA